MLTFRTFIILITLLFCFGCNQSDPTTSFSSGTTLDDNPENREKLAVKYFKLVPMQSMMKDMGEEMAMRMPKAAKEEFLKYWETFLDDDQIDQLESAARQSMAKHMNTSELQAFIEFMENPAGKSAMGKMKYYMADIMPLIQQQSMAAIQKFHSGNK